MNLRLENKDCMAVMAEYPDKYFDLACVDPPYENADAIGIIDNKNNKKQLAKRTKYHLFENIKPDDYYFIELQRISKNQIVWGGNYLGLSGGVIVWNKRGTAFGEGEVAICSTHKSVRIFEYTWNGMLQENMKNKEERIHPTQKPIALYDWILANYAKKEFKYLDTHLGSFSSLIAADKFGISEFVGCEIDKDYFDNGLKRYNTYKAQKRMF